MSFRLGMPTRDNRFVLRRGVWVMMDQGSAARQSIGPVLAAAATIFNFAKRAGWFRSLAPLERVVARRGINP